MSDQSLAKVPHYLSRTAAAYALLSGLLALVGWATETYRLTDWIGTGITMKANAAIAAAAAGAALLLRASHLPGRTTAVRVLGAFVATAGGLTLLEHVGSWNFGIDTLLYDEAPGAAATAAPGRMGPPASTSFLALGTGMVLLTCGPRAQRFSVVLGLAVLAIGTLSLTGHWYGAESMYTIPRLTGIAAQTATILISLGIGIIAANPDRQPMRTLVEPSMAGHLARRLVPLVILGPLVLGWLRILGQRQGLYDAAFGAALRSVVEVILLSVFVWWSIRAIRERDRERRRVEDDLRSSEQRLRETLAALLESDRRKDQFLATLAHELRNPLAPIRNAAQILKSKASADPMLDWSAGVIARQVQHMARLLEDLLDVSRISLNRLEVRREGVELTAIIQGAVETSRPTIDEAGHLLTVDVSVEPIHLDGDAVRLAQVFANLLNNATKYSEEGGRIRLAARREGAEAVVIVTDEGTGIAKDMLPRVFDMFTQGESSPALGGLGIGLWLAKSVVELHGGRIEAHSDGLGKGSEFVVRLPLIVDIGAAAPAEANESLGGAISRRILVVDDLRDSADTLAMLLESLGHEVETAYDGRSAIEVAARFLPDTILLDIGMSEVDGFEVCRSIRHTSCGFDVCIVAVTGWGQPEDRRRTREAGFDEHLVKPVDAAMLTALLSALPNGLPAKNETQATANLQPRATL